MDIQDQLQQALAECERLKQENEELKHLLAECEKENKKDQSKKKIEIFKHLFKGRSDVFPVRWVTKEGRAGYSPSKNSQQQFHPLTDQTIYDHLTGKHTIGIYPMLKDNTCFFLAIDFDKDHWQQDAQAFVTVCEKHEIPVSIERSRSGNGCHVWVFFSEPVPAATARELGNCLLEQTVDTHGRLDSYDRKFPSQDTLSEGGFGNLIALPLQREPRNSGNSVFTDKNFSPYDDQWAYLSTIQKLSLDDILKIIRGSTNNNGNEVAIERKNGVIIQKANIPSDVINECKEVASFSNPKYHIARSTRMSTKNIPRKIRAYDEESNHVILPRGCYEKIIDILNKNEIHPQIYDNRNEGNPIKTNFSGQLLDEQQAALDELTSHSDGILVAPTGFGKTVIAAALIAKRKVNTLVIVDRTQLIQQWKERLQSFLEISPKTIGQIGGGKKKATGIVDIATYQSLHRKEAINEYGQIIVDECHHAGAVSFEDILKATDAKFVHGLTATPKRKDGLEPIMRMQCGPLRYKVKTNVHHFEHLLIPRYTSFQSENEKLQDLYEEISNHEGRNETIFNDVLTALDRGRSPLVLTERLDHVAHLEGKFSGLAKNLIVLTGKLTKSEKEKRLEKLRQVPTDEECLIIATGKYIGEGFDDERLDTLFLTMPISWKGILQQYVGRLQRAHAEKTSIEVYDYVDDKVPQLKKMYDEKRRKGYKALGFKTEEERKDGQQMTLF
ncbi:DEAD/DEAH box helicase [Natribacillus halophilus]|uniref:Helicase ATP-binding domain-containing protein n=1 Tax=Natribacillus halophilus TaxID=549003 RepID=A0A1G8NHK2_9BACI|nr:DEAD/DEAH box helicase [Natribacillus halophilus]SDI79546.1 hypothetical protein SAMN04488123_10683 [Natribacillus halophilus]